MASLVDGKIVSAPIAKINSGGEFERADSSFRETIHPHEAQKDRYHLFVSYACPWAHRTLITRNIKKLNDIISISVSDPFMGEQGWTFSAPTDPQTLASVYVTANPHYTGKITVPVLWDKQVKTIVNNESSEIIRILNSAFDHMTDSDIDLYPEHLRSKIDIINRKIYSNVNNGVYKTGFAGTQKAYELAFDHLFKTLDEIERILSVDKFLAGDYFTEADLRLFTTLIRFDVVYYVHFKCNKKRIMDYPNIFSYLKSIYQLPEVKETCHFGHIKEHYYLSHQWLNPSRIIPKGPELLNLNEKHDRGDVKFWLKRQ